MRLSVSAAARTQTTAPFAAMWHLQRWMLSALQALQCSAVQFSTHLQWLQTYFAPVVSSRNCRKGLPIPRTVGEPLLSARLRCRVFGLGCCNWPAAACPTAVRLRVPTQCSVGSSLLLCIMLCMPKQNAACAQLDSRH